MQLDFEIGDAHHPRGHAFVYFRSSIDPNQVLASYLIVPPIALNLSRYIPPMFAGSLPGIDLDQLTRAVPLPPIPEPVESHDHLRRLADRRGDDLIAAGTVDPNSPERLMMAVAAAVEAYATAYRAAIEREPIAPPPPALELSVEEVLYDLMTEADRLQELVKLVGKLRYGIELRDGEVADEAGRQIEALGRRLPESYRIPQLIAAIRRPDATGARLADLYVQRAYKLHQQQYADLIDLEHQIQQLEARTADG